MIALLSRGWPVFLAAVAGNAAVQAVLVVPFLAPSFALGFVMLSLVSFLVLAGAVAFVVAGVRSAARRGGRGWPRWPEWLASAVLVLAVALASLVSTWLVSLAILVTLVVLAGVALGRGSAGFAVFRRTPVRATLLVLVSLVILVVIGPPGLGTLLAGFFITGWPAAALTWLAFGAAGVALLCAWTALAGRSRDPSTTAHERAERKDPAPA